MVIGWEALIVLQDLRGLTPDEQAEVSTWAARADPGRSARPAGDASAQTASGRPHGGQARPPGTSAVTHGRGGISARAQATYVTGLRRELPVLCA